LAWNKICDFQTDSIHVKDLVRVNSNRFGEYNRGSRVLQHASRVTDLCGWMWPLIDHWRTLVPRWNLQLWVLDIGYASQQKTMSAGKFPNLLISNNRHSLLTFDVDCRIPWGSPSLRSLVQRTLVVNVDAISVWFQWLYPWTEVTDDITPVKIMD